MSELLDAILLGIVQGLTEFLPVSSSGHLELVKYLVGDETRGEHSLLMTVVLHFATALATMFVFRQDIALLIRQIWQRKRNEGHLFVGKILLSMIPAAFIGIFFEEAIEALFERQLIVVGLALFFTAILLIVADLAKKTDKEVTFGSSLLIGMAQAIAIIPGISRSGATIATAVILSIDRERAARFSFLMVVPLIFGKIASDLIWGELLATDNHLALGAGFVAAFVTGVAACVWMLKLVKLAKLRYFGWYCILVGFLSISLGMGLISYA